MKRTQLLGIIQLHTILKAEVNRYINRKNGKRKSKYATGLMNGINERRIRLP
jgi:hypothetical protein